MAKYSKQHDNMGFEMKPAEEQKNIITNDMKDTQISPSETNNDHDSGEYKNNSFHKSNA